MAREYYEATLRELPFVPLLSLASLPFAWV
jgi:hypothetical protein